MLMMHGLGRLGVVAPHVVTCSTGGLAVARSLARRQARKKKSAEHATASLAWRHGPHVEHVSRLRTHHFFGRVSCGV